MDISICRFSKVSKVNWKINEKTFKYKINLYIILYLNILLCYYLKNIYILIIINIYIYIYNNYNLLFI